MVENGPSALPADFSGYRDPGDLHPHTAAIWWDENADEYLTEHGEDLGAAEFVWGPEGWHESELHLLGPLDSLRAGRVLEVGCGAGQCARWLRSQGVDVVATDISEGMVAASARLDAATGIVVGAQVADARHLPFPDQSFDVVFTSYGVIPFVADAQAVHQEVARVLRPGGRWVFSTTHPIRWAFPDDPSERGLTATRSYFDRRPYIEADSTGQVVYAEFHRTVGDHVADVVGAGLNLVRLVEPTWPETTTRTWDGWSPLRGRLLPGTLIVVAERPPTAG